MVDRDKYRRLFIDEARENLREYANQLVEFEKHEKAADAERSRAALDACFRAAHSLKGMAASLGYDAFTEVAHHLEDLADRGRQGRALGAEAVDLLLEGGDALEGMVDVIADGREGELRAGDLPDRVAALLAQMDGAPPPAPAAEAPAPAATPAAAVAAGADQRVVAVRFGEDTPLPQVRAFMLHRALSDLEGYARTEPEADVIKKGLPDDRTVRFVFAASADLEAVSARAQQEQGVVEVSVEEPAAAAPEPAPVAEASPRDDDRTIRVRTSILDEFIDSVGELLLARSRLRAFALRHEAPELEDLVDEVERLTRDLHDRVVAARLTPLSFVTDRLPRVVRDLSRQSGKGVDLVLEVGEIELDRAILDELFTPLIHMLRNAVDHGHEGDAARKAAGKSPSMSLTLAGSRDRDRVVLSLTDDGGGIDAAKVKARAVERGLIDEATAEVMPDARAVELVCAPGFSTAEQVTETSGRGVGMDVVKATLERLGGDLLIQSTLGEGTRFVLHLPLTVAIIKVLVVEAGDEGGRSAFAIPVARVDRALDLQSHRVSLAQGRPHITVEDALVPLYDLSQELGFDAAETGRAEGTAILIERGDEQVALRVTAVVGQEEVVAKPLGRPLADVGYVSGATLLADGRAAFILDPNRLAGEVARRTDRA
jgi:two-component system chemotaxis sensor kinase CheA